MREKGKVWTPDEIRENIQKDDKWLARSILAIYQKQTADEQSSQRTKHENGVGFNRVDAKFMSSLALFFQVNGYFSPKQKAIARKKIVKYKNQLALIANGEI